MTIFDQPIGSGCDTSLSGSSTFASLESVPWRAPFAPVDARIVGAACYATELERASPLSRLATGLGETLCRATPNFHAAFLVPGLGRFEIRIVDTRSVLRLMLYCDTAAGQAWLAVHQRTLEERLAYRLGRPVALAAANARRPPPVPQQPQHPPEP
jgi:hypothetical protein